MSTETTVMVGNMVGNISQALELSDHELQEFVQLTSYEWGDLLYYAIEDQDLPSVKRILGTGAVSQCELNSALEHSVRGGLTEFVPLFLQAGASPDAHMSEALTIAARHNEAAIGRLLLEAGADPDCENTGAALVAAAGYGHLAFVELLLAAGSSAAICKAFDLAVIGGHDNVIHVLIHTGRVPVSNIRYGIHLAVIGGQHDTMCMLAAVAPPSQPLLNDALGAAVAPHGYFEVSKTLLEMGAQVTPDMIRQAGYFRCTPVQLLLKHRSQD